MDDIGEWQLPNTAVARRGISYVSILFEIHTAASSYADPSMFVIRKLANGMSLEQLPEPVETGTV